jgi:hypothetical protein
VYRQRRRRHSRLKHSPEIRPAPIFLQLEVLCWGRSARRWSSPPSWSARPSLNCAARQESSGRKPPKYVPVKPPIVTSPRNVSEAMERTRQELIAIWSWRDYARW